MIALARYGGLRTPLETPRLRPATSTGRPGVSPSHRRRTEHHERKGSRIVPLFPELLRHPCEALTSAADGAEHVITRYR